MSDDGTIPTSADATAESADPTTTQVQPPTFIYTWSSAGDIAHDLEAAASHLADPACSAEDIHIAAQVMKAASRAMIRMLDRVQAQPPRATAHAMDNILTIGHMVVGSGVCPEVADVLAGALKDAPHRIDAIVAHMLSSPEPAVKETPGVPDGLLKGIICGRLRAAA